MKPLKNHSESSHITVLGACQNNLRGLDVSIPKGLVTLLVGPSGSGKSSLTHDTLLAESNFRSFILEALQNGSSLLGQLARPKARSITGLPIVVTLNQTALPGCKHSLASYLGLQKELFDFFALQGKRYCQTCARAGRSSVVIAQLSTEQIVEELLNISPDLLVRVCCDVSKHAAAQLRQQGFVNVLCQDQEIELNKNTTALPANSYVILDKLKLTETNRSRLREAIERARFIASSTLQISSIAETTNKFNLPLGAGCRACGYAARRLKLSDFVLNGSARSDGGTELSVLAGLTELEQRDLLELNFGCSLEQTLNSPISSLGGAFPEGSLLRRYCKSLQSVNLGHLSLLRHLDTLSSGEKFKLACIKNSTETHCDALFLLDNPEATLSCDETLTLIESVRAAQSSASTLLITAQTLDLIESAQHVIALGPAAGHKGGQLMACGTASQIVAQLPAGKPSAPKPQYLPGAVEIVVRARNLITQREYLLQIPLQALTCISAPSAAGKSSLLFGGLYTLLKTSKAAPLAYALANLWDVKVESNANFAQVVALEELLEPTARSSVVATYIDLLTPVRELFARLDISRMRGYSAANFKMPLAPESWDEQILAVKFKGLSIAQILNLTAEESFEVLGNLPGCGEALNTMQQIGLGYLTLAQPVTTLSSSQLQRLRLARELKKKRKNCLYLLERPCAGLAEIETDKVVELLRQIVGVGSTVVAIDHNRRFIEACDREIALN